MKKLFTLLLFVSLCTINFAQTSANTFLLDSTTVSKYSYCEIVGTSNLIGTKVSVELDFGQRVKLFQDTRYKDSETGKVVKFNSMVDAMNFMGKNGWEFCQAYAITTGNQNVYHFLLKKCCIKE